MRLDPTTYEITAIEQRRLETEMVTTSQSKFMEKVEKAKKNGELANQPWARKAVTGWLEPAAAALSAWLEEARHKRGPNPPIMKYADVLGADLTMAIAVRVVLNSYHQMTDEKKQSEIALRIGKSVLNEYAVALMAKDLDDKEFRRIREQANKAGRSRARRLLREAEQKGYIDVVDEPDMLRLGASLIKLLERHTDLLYLHALDREAKDAKKRRKGQRDQTLYVSLTDEAVAAIDSAVDRALYSPEMGYWPMVLPPKRWSHDKKGGYITGPVRRTYGLIRAKGKDHRYEKGMPELSPEVYQAINTLQDVPFRVNKSVLDVIIEMLSAELELPKMVSPDTINLPTHPETVDGDDGFKYVVDESDGEMYMEGTSGWSRIWTTYFATSRTQWEIREKLKGNLMESQRAIHVAIQFRDYPRIYFPWKADFRGRMYPLPQGLNPQGSKVAQGLLEFAEGKPAGERGVYWLHVHAANTYGEDKLTLDERYQWAIDNTNMMLRVAKDPIGMAYWWGKADKPYQFLAVCLEWPDVVTNGHKHVSHIPVAVDGTCNGLQHLSAISRDRATAELVNLAPGERPQDVYGAVAKATSETLETIDLDEEDNKMAHAWLAFGVDRKVAKRPVMTMPYGSTYFAVGDFILEALYDRLGTSREHDFPGSLGDAMMFLKPHLWAAIKETIPGARQTMDWLQGAAACANKANLPVSWVTPDGFHVVQAYKEAASKPLDMLVAGVRLTLVHHEPTDDLRKKKQISSIVPNFVHSLDGCHARMYINHAAERGVTGFMMVHDDYRAHACDVDQMNRSIRETFVTMYASDVTKPLLDALKEQGTPYEEPLVTGDFNIEEVLDSTYFFG